MSTTTDFIAELFRAGNEVGKLNAFEKRRLLERAANTLRGMHDLAGGSQAQKLSDSADRLDAYAARAETLSDDELKTALTVAADVIRIMRVLLGAKDEALRDDP